MGLKDTTDLFMVMYDVTTSRSKSTQFLLFLFFLIPFITVSYTCDVVYGFMGCTSSSEKSKPLSESEEYSSHSDSSEASACEVHQLSGVTQKLARLVFSYHEERGDEEGTRVCRNSPLGLEAEALMYVDQGADCFQKVYQGSTHSVGDAAMLCTTSILHRLIQLGLSRAVEAVMRGAVPVDFTVVDGCGRTVLHELCSAARSLPALTWSTIAAAVVQRAAARRVGDLVNWNTEDVQHFDLLSYAAHCQVLHRLWPHLREVDHFNASTTIFSITSVVAVEDWNRLDPEERRGKFRCREGHTNAATLSLITFFESKRSPFTDVVQSEISAYVESGADVLLHCPFSYYPLLHFFILSENIACVAMCMRSPHTIDFTAVDLYGRTPFHVVCTASSDVVARGLLSAILHRVRSRADDHVDFGAKDRNRDTFYTCAVKSGVWPSIVSLLEVDELKRIRLKRN